MVSFKGYDWRGSPMGMKLARDFVEVGVEIVYLPRTMHTSCGILRPVLATSESLRRRRGRRLGSVHTSHGPYLARNVMGLVVSPVWAQY